MAVGALCGALLSVITPFPTLFTAILAALALAIAQAATAWLPTPATFAAGLAFVGLLQMLTDVGNLSIVQAASPARIKGRLLALQSVLYLGGQGIGGLLIDVAVAAVGPRLAMTASGAVTGVLVLMIALYTRSRARWLASSD